jgi:hypothetical protein
MDASRSIATANDGRPSVAGVAARRWIHLLFLPSSIGAAFGNFFISLPAGAAESPLPIDLSSISVQFGDCTEAPLLWAAPGGVIAAFVILLSGEKHVVKPANRQRTG